MKKRVNNPMAGGAMAALMFELFSRIERHTTAWGHRGSQGR